MKRLFILALTVMVTVAALSGCGIQGMTDTSTSGKESEKLNVIVTNFPPYDIVRQIAGDKVALMQLLPLGGESHTYEPTTSELLAIQKCDLFIYAGGEGDAWVEKILSALDTNGVTALTMLSCVEPLTEETVEGMEAEEEEEGLAYDEHVWTSPKRVIQIAEKITKTLETLDPDNAAFYRQNAADYAAKLSQLDKAYSDAVASATGDTLIVADRFPFRYLVNDYHLKYYAAFPGCSSNTADPSAKLVNFLIDKVKTEKIPEVLYIELSDQKLANTISEATGCQTAELFSCHNITQEQFQDGITYISLMTENLTVLKTALNY